MKNDESEEAVDPTVGEYLSASDFDKSPNQERTEALQDSIKDIKIRVTEVAPKPSGTQNGEPGKTLVDDEEGDIVVTDLPGEGGSGSKGQGGHGGNGGGSNPGDGGGNVPVEHRKKLSSISAASVRNVVRNKATGEYTIVFTPGSSATDGVLEVFMSAESQNYDASIVAAYCSECPDLKFSQNRITNLVFNEKKALRVDSITMAKKRTNGEGHIRQRKNGLWECTIMDGFQPNGKRKYKSFYGNTQSEVKKKMRAYLRAKEEGVILAHEYTFSEWAELWFENHKDNIQSTTQESYRYTLRILEGHFGRRKLDQIKAYDIEQFLKQLRQSKASNSRISQCRGMLFQIFNKAVANDLLNKNPAAYADKMRKARPKPKEAFTTREVQLLLDKLPQNKIGWSIRLMLGTGMRTQELLGLEPRHIAEDGSTITIEQAVCMDKGTATLGTPKSFDSYRSIPVPENLRCYAKLLRDTPDKFIWESSRKPGMPCNPSTFRTQFQKAVKGVEGVRILTPHSCRHTYVSQMQMLGVDLATIQSIVGHADVDMTKHYLHVQEPVKLAAIGKFSSAFSGGKGPDLDVLDHLESL